MGRLGADGWTATVVGIQVVRPGAEAMRDLTVANVYTYVVGAGKWVVHNCGQNNTFIGQRMRRRVNDDLLDPPAKRGDTPIEKATGRPIEIHHLNQDPNGPFEEMTAYEHRMGGNSKINHPITGKGYTSPVNRALS